MSTRPPTQSKAFFPWFGAASTLAALLALGCSGGSGGSGGTGGTTSTGGVTSSGGTTQTGGTGGAALPACELPLPGFGVSVSLHETGKPTEIPSPPNPQTVFTTSGVVTEVGSGPFPEDCGYVSAGEEGVWAIFTDADGKSWTACYTAPNAKMPVEVGDAVDVDFQPIWADIVPPSFALTLRKGGSLVLFAADQNGSTVLWPEEVNAANGEETCFTDDPGGCGIRGYKVALTAGDATTEVTPGETVTLGGYEFHVGVWTKWVDSGFCDNGSSAHQIFIVPAP